MRWSAVLPALGLLILAACQPGSQTVPAAATTPAPSVLPTFQDCSDCPVMIKVHTGRFVMGAPAEGPDHTDYERPRHDVTIDHGFALSQSPVTRGQYAAFVKDSGYAPRAGCSEYAGKAITVPDRPTLDWSNPGYQQPDADPVVCLNAGDINAYLGWLAKRTGKRYRLPSEAEWEYAARAGNYEDRYFPDGDPAVFCRYVNGADADFNARFGQVFPLPNNTACHDGYVFTSPVGTFPRNAWGFNDMIGNVMQIVADDYHDTYMGAPADGSAWIDKHSSYVLRGGSWYTSVAGLSVVWRTGQQRDWRLPFAGFRVAESD